MLLAPSHHSAWFPCVFAWWVTEIGSLGQNKIGVAGAHALASALPSCKALTGIR